MFWVGLLFTTGSYGYSQRGSYRLLLQAILRHSVPEMSVQEAAQHVKGYLFLDARERREYDVSHIAGARWVGYETFQVDKVGDIDKKTPIVVYCSVGYRSEKIAEQLLSVGFERVWNLYGGIFEWVNQGFPVYDALGPTENVHAYDRKWGVWLKRGKKVY